MSVQLRNQSGLLERVAGFNDTDAVLSPTSRNPVQNKTIYNALSLKIEKTVDDLVNYYTTAQCYNKQEVRELIGAINTLTIEVVAALPTTDISATTIYFVGPATGTNTYDEYVYVGSAWVKIGDTNIDLSDYISSADLTTALQSYYTKTAVDALLSANYYDKDDVDDLLDAKEDVLTFDSTPTAGSSNPVTSAGIKTALDAKQNTLSFDTTPTASSTKPVTSDGIKTALDAKQNALTFDTTPTANSLNPVTSGGIFNVLGNVSVQRYTLSTPYTTAIAADTWIDTGFDFKNYNGVSYDRPLIIYIRIDGYNGSSFWSPRAIALGVRANTNGTNYDVLATSTTPHQNALNASLTIAVKEKYSSVTDGHSIYVKSSVAIPNMTSITTEVYVLK